jgi:hypothetical protein
MANTNNPIGAKAIGSIIAANLDLKLNTYYLPASDTDNVFINDVVAVTGESNEDGIPIARRAAADEDFRGYVAGFSPQKEYENILYRRGSTDRIVYVADSPFILVEMQVNGLIDETAIGKNADIILNGGELTTGISKTQLDITTISTDGRQFKILRIIERVDNSLGEYTKVMCIAQRNDLLKGLLLHHDTFLELLDTPNSYTAAKALYRVNDSKTAVAETSVLLDDSVANQVSISFGTTTLTASASSQLNQDLTNTASPIFNNVTLSSLNTLDGIVTTNGSGVLSSSTDIPNGTTATTQSPLDGSTKLATTEYVDLADAEGIDEDQIFYIGKHGSNVDNDGKNIAEAFFTCAKAFLSVFSDGPPSASTPYAVQILDGGVYEQACDMTNITYTHLIGEAATIKSNDGVITNGCSIKVHEFARYTTVGYTITKKGSGVAHIEADRLYNSVATGGCIFIDNGTFVVDGADEASAPLKTDVLVSGNPANTGKKLFISRKRLTRGIISTTAILDDYGVHADLHEGNIQANANSIIRLDCGDWDGIIASAGALSTVIVNCQRRLSDPVNDTFDATAKIIINEAKSPFFWGYRSVNLSVLGSTLTKIGIDSTPTSEPPYQIVLSGGGARVNTPGVYHIEAGFAIDPSAVGTSREISLQVGSTVIAKDTETQQASAPAPSDKQNAHISVVRRLKKGDIVDLYVWQNDGTLTVHATATYQYQTFLRVNKIGN